MARHATERRTEVMGTEPSGLSTEDSGLVALVRGALPLLTVGIALDAGFAFFVMVVQAFLPETMGTGAGAPGFALGIYGATRVALQFPGGVLARRVGPARLIAVSF